MHPVESVGVPKKPVVVGSAMTRLTCLLESYPQPDMWYVAPPDATGFGEAFRVAAEPVEPEFPSPAADPAVRPSVMTTVSNTRKCLLCSIGLSSHSKRNDYPHTGDG